MSNFSNYHDGLAAPPHASAGPTVVDPFHFVLFQHGVLGYAGDFENVIADLIIHHDVSLHEAYAAAVRRADRARTSAARAQRRASAAPSSPNDGPRREQTSHRSGVSRGALPESYSSLWGESESESSDEGHSRRAVQRRAARREEYRASHFSLRRTYPFHRSGRLYQSGNLCCFAPGENNFLGTGAGTVACARRLLAEFLPVFRAWLDLVEQRAAAGTEGSPVMGEVRPPGGADGGGRKAFPGTVDVAAGASSEASGLSSSTGSGSATGSPTSPARRVPVCFSCVGHSFGGLILREFLYLLTVDTVDLPRADAELYAGVLSVRLRMMQLRVQFENFLTIATPHCGTTECLWWPLYLGAWVGAKLRIFPTYGELIVSDSESLLMKRLVDVPHLVALKLFRRRTLFANTHRDLLVGFATSALIFETVPDDHTKAKGYRNRWQAPCAAAFDSDESELSAAIYLPAHGECGDLGATGSTTSMPRTLGCASPLAAATTATRRAITHPARASHTLFDLWVFSHARETRTLAPVDPLLMVSPAPPLPPTTPHPLSPRAMLTRLRPWLRRGLARLQPASARYFPWLTASEHEPALAAASMDAPPSATLPTKDVAREGGKELGSGASVRDAWHRPAHIFTESTAAESGGEAAEAFRVGVTTMAASMAPTAASTRSSADADLTSSVTAAHYTASGHPPPSIQFHLAEVVTPEDVLESLRAALAPSLSATMVARGVGRRAGSAGSRLRPPVTLGTRATRRTAATHVDGDAPSSSAASAAATEPLTPAGSWAWVWPSSPVLPRSPLPSLCAAAAERCGWGVVCTSPSPGLPRTPTAPVESSVPASTLTAPARLLRVCFVDAPLALLDGLLTALALVCGLLLRAIRQLFAWGARRAPPPVLSLGSGRGPEGARCVPDDDGSGGEPDEDDAARLRRLLLEHIRALPPSRLTPRAIAHELRRDLDWRVRAVRSNLVLPFAHVVSLGNWAWAGTSPSLVMAVAEEIAHIM